jgi:hypothetical protein
MLLCELINGGAIKPVDIATNNSATGEHDCSLPRAGRLRSDACTLRAQACAARRRTAC